MDLRWQLCFSFGLGILLQLLLFTNFRPRLRYLGMGAGGSLVLFAFSGFPLSVTLFLYYGVFSLFCSFAFFRSIVPLINEYIILALTVVFWYVYAVYYQFTLVNNVLFLILFIFCTLATLVVAFSNQTLTFVWKIVMFLWYFVMVAMLMIYIFGSNVTSTIFNLSPYFGGLVPAFNNTMSLTDIPWYAALLTGMGFICLIANFVYVLGMSPLPMLLARRNKHFRQKLEAWRSVGLELFVKRFGDSQIPVRYSWYIIFGLSAVFSLNFFVRLVDPNLLILFFIISPAFVVNYDMYLKFRQKNQHLFPPGEQKK